jgi:VWFA-related protein
VFRTEVQHVEVDAFVTDAGGKAVAGLTRDDFQVFEEGVRQDITVFAEVSVPLDRVDAAPDGAAPLPRDVATNDEGVRGRLFALVLDELHTDARRSGDVRRLAAQFIQRHLARNDLAAIVSVGGSGTQGFTGDERRLLEAVERFTGRKLPSATLERLRTIERQQDMLRSEPGPGDGRPRPEVIAPRPGLERDPHDLERVHAARASMEVLERVARGFGDVEGRRKAILLFSEGIDYDTLDVMGATQRNASAVVAGVRDAIAVATRHGVAVYTVDPRGPLSPVGSAEDMPMPAATVGADFGVDSRSFGRELRISQDSLRTLAEQTGGIAFVDTNDFTAAYERIVRASSRYYLLGYYPADSRRDGAYRRLEVRVARRGLAVVAREGYVRPGPDGEKEEPPPVAAAAETSPELRALLASPWSQPGLPMAVNAAAFEERDGEAAVALTIELAGKGLSFRQEEDRAASDIEVSFVVVDARGRVRAGDRLLARPRLSAPTRELVGRSGLRFVQRVHLPPGRYQVRVAARESVGGQRGSVSYELEVPDYRAGPLGMSGVLLASRDASRSLTPVVDEAVQDLLAAPPTAGRSFVVGDAVTAYTEVYDALAPAHDLAITTRVASADGREVFREARLRPWSDRAEPGGFRHRVEIPLAGLGPGRYLLQITATPTLGEPTSSRELTFDVVPASPRDAAEARHAPSFPAGSLPRPRSRIDRLEAWLAAVERHEPGRADAAAQMVRSWTPDDLQDLAADVALIAALLRDPQYPVMWLVDPSRPGRPRRAPYTADDERRLRALASDAVKPCSPECARNRLLKRGAVLHTDALVRGAAEEAASPAGKAANPARFVIRFSDGQQSGMEEAAGHWEFARTLLDNVAPNPTRDDTVRLWYVAVTAYGQLHERHTRLEDRAVDLFPEDADLLLLAGTFHEVLASPRMQSLARSVHLPAGVSHGIGDERAELREAEKMYRRALAVRTGLTEARVRLGRVLQRLGRTEPAVRELRQAASDLSSRAAKADADGGLLLYYAEMFLGAAHEALGRYDSAKASYGRAAALYPEAPSPRLALSQLALRGHDRAQALSAVQAALRLPAHPGDSADPWWRYHVVQGRKAPSRLDELYRSLGP